MYNQLLYSAGGGIISNEQKAVRANCATLAIGLGGTGIDCLRRLKRMVYGQLLPDDPKALVPTYSNIKFLAVDSDRSCLEADGIINNLDRETEFFDISCEDTQRLLRNVRSLTEKPECRWLKTQNPEKGESGLRVRSATDGAGGSRQLGRLLLIEKSDAFVNKVIQLVMEAKEAVPMGADVNIHIISGLCGGTGSGIFLDVCYLVQKALDQIGEGGHAITCGYFFLPNVNLSLPQLSRRPELCTFYQANGYAAMKELDYCMGFDRNGGCWEQEYIGFKVGPVSKPPVKLCHLISAFEDESYDTSRDKYLINRYEDVISMVGKFIMQFLVRSSIDMTTHIENCRTAMSRVRKEHGASYKYITFGVSDSVVPFTKISTYLVSKMFENFKDIREKYPTNEEIAQFAKENGLDFWGLLKLVMDKTSFDMYIPGLLERQYRGSLYESDLSLPNELILPDGIMTLFRNKRDKMAAQVETNIAALTQDWKRDTIRENDKSIAKVWKVFFALEQVVADPDKGPYYAPAVLYGSARRNLVDLLMSNLEMIGMQLRNNSNDVKRRMDEVKKTRSEYLHPRLFQNRQRLFDTFIAATASYFELTAKTLVLEKMQGMILKMMEQFKDLYKIHFEPFRRIYDGLLETFHENYVDFDRGMFQEDVNAPFGEHFLELDEYMMARLDEAVKGRDPAQEARRFSETFFSADDVWAENDRDKIVKFISDYMIKAFGDDIRSTIRECIWTFHRNAGSPSYSANICRLILRPLSEMNMHLLRGNRSFCPTQGDFGYISVSDVPPGVINAANELIKEDPDLHLVTSAFNKWYQLMRFMCGVPMYGWGKMSLYRKAYMDDYHYVGRHIYEGTESDSRDWRKLPELLPFSMVENPTEKMLENEKEYLRAVECGIIHADDSDYYRPEYHLDEYEGIDKIESLARRAREECDSRIAKEVFSEIEDYLQNRQPVNVLTIPNDGNDGCKEIVRKDYVMGSNVYLDAIERQLGILDAIDRIKASMDHVVELDTLMDEYCNALYTGVLEYKFPFEVTFTVVDPERSETIKLSDSSMEPYGMPVPFYQGFVSYLELEEELRLIIKNEMENRLYDPLTYLEQITTARENLKMLKDEKYMMAVQYQAMKFPDKTSEIESLYRKLFRWTIDFPAFGQLGPFGSV